MGSIVKLKMGKFNDLEYISNIYIGYFGKSSGFEILLCSVKA